jgi:hypothetical protein
MSCLYEKRKKPTEPAQSQQTKNSNIPLTAAATSNPCWTYNQFGENNPALDINPFEETDPYYGMTDEINNLLNVKPSIAEVGGAHVVSIKGHSWHAGQLQLWILWNF